MFQRTALLVCLLLATNAYTQTPYLHDKRAAESPAVQQLRKNAQAMTDGAANLIATYNQTMGPKARYEVRIIDGRQIPKTTPAPGLFIGDEWSRLPALLGTNLRIQIEQIDAHTFTFKAPVEAQAAWFTKCAWRCRTFPVSTHGEVTIDDQSHIRRIAEWLDVPQLGSSWNSMHLVVNYGIWMFETKAVVVPMDIQISGIHNGKAQMTGGTFTEYHRFSASAELHFDTKSE